MSEHGLVLQHGGHAPPGLLGDWLAARAIPYRVHEAGREALPADPAGLPFVASLGSETSANADDPAWVALEIDFLRRAVDANVPVLGLCFGGQALARALGAAVVPGPAEVGWIRIETDEPRRIPAGPWLVFHSEFFEVPDGARELARNAGGPQAFALGPHLATQFHPEVTPEIVDGWAAFVETRATPFQVDRRALLATGRRCAAEAASHAERLFDAWWARAASWTGAAAGAPAGRATPARG
jgi:GMP synthase-like glutamine amidotransferase